MNDEIDDKTLAELKKIRESFNREYSSFPTKCCWEAGKRIEKILGFRFASGVFRIYNHHWNVTSDGKIVDITVGQFDENLPDIYILKKNSLESKDYQEKVCGYNL